MNPPRIALYFVVVLVLCSAVGRAIAEDGLLAGAGGFAPVPAAKGGGVGGPARGESHAWVAVPASGLSENAAIVHLPPRIAAGETDPHADAGEGAVRMAAPLPVMPERMAAWGNLLYMAFVAEVSAGGDARRPVLTVEARRGPLGGSWVAESEGQRLDALPSLPGEGRLAGLAGSEYGPAALLRGRDGGYELLVLRGREWRRASLPSGAVEAGAGEVGKRLELVAQPAGLGVVLIDGKRGGRWTGTLPEGGGAGEGENGELRIVWERRAFSMLRPGGEPGPMPVSGIFLVGGQHVYCARSPGGPVEIWSPGEAVNVKLAEVQGVAQRFAAAPLDQVGRLALVWQEPDPRLAEAQKARPEVRGKSPPPIPMRTRVAEVSVFSGAVMYEGLAKVGGPVSSQELRLLAMAMVGLMLVVLLIVLRPTPGAGAPVSLPKGVVLAEPGRRMFAGLIDVAIAAMAASAATGIPVVALFSFSGLVREPGTLVGLLLLLGVGFAHGTIGEWLFGRTIGKAIAGCVVGRPVMVQKEDGTLTPEVAKISLGAAAMRNLVKWALPPLAAAGVSNPERRHRGDVASGTAVLMRVEDEEKPRGRG